LTAALPAPDGPPAAVVGPPRILPLVDPDPETAEALARAWPAQTVPANIMTTLAHHRHLLRRFSAFGGVFTARSALLPRIRELVVLRVSWHAGCQYEWLHHVALAHKAGLNDVEIIRLTRPELAEEWSREERDVVTFTDESVTTGTVSDPTWQRLRASWSDAQLIELVMLIGYYRLAAGLLNTVRVAIEPELLGASAARNSADPARCAHD
jgi:4-carboxymuconolactone decarboxylase